MGTITNYLTDNRIVLTLDAGGTNFVFSAIRAGHVIAGPVTLPAIPDRLDACLGQLRTGFSLLIKQLPEPPVAISFAFPGPADYRNGIIGDLPNFPAFRGGVALGPFLEEQFNLPVFIHNDGNLFAYGEAFAGVLPEVNARLQAAGSTRQYRNLIGVTLGTGFGAGVVVNGDLLTGDNDCGGDVWCLRNKKYPDKIAEESVSIRAVIQIYKELSGDPSLLTPATIFEIAEGNHPGNRQAAIAAFSHMGEVVGDVLATALTLIDGLVVIGGGLSGAYKYLLPAILDELNGTLQMGDRSSINRLQMKVYNLDKEEEFAGFIGSCSHPVVVRDSNRRLSYDPLKRTGLLLSKQGASHSISMGAYLYALNHL